MKVRAILLVSLIAFAVTLAVIIGERLSGEAMAVIVGVIAGVAASIPTSLIVVWVATRRRADEARVQSYQPAPPAAPEPRIVVVTPSQAPPASQYSPTFAAPYPPITAAPRTFSVIGGEDDPL